MKRYIDISYLVSGSVLSRLTELKTWMDYEDLAALNSELAGLTNLYVPGNEIKKTDISSVYCGRYFTKAWIVDINDATPSDVLTCDILGETEDSFVAGDSLLIRTGWSKNHSDRNLYFDKYPTVGVDLVEWLARKQANMILTDTPFLANNHYLPEFKEVYAKLGESGILVVTGVTNLDILSNGSVELVIMPLKVRELNYSLVRAVAILT
ncbi:cyclase family protein [Saccharicrinis sp. FJH62]|uniref:cyclase family protein n=1 Tax=Saccharicrinis sp. FJH62 TaxID=3344657 RepID=UPI0035D500E1